MLCEEFADVFERPGPAPDRPITHSIDLQDEAAAPPKTNERTKVFMLSAVFLCLNKEPHPTVQLW